MSKATLIVRKAAVRPEQVVDAVVLDHAARKAATGRLSASGGTVFDLALEKTVQVEDGDAFRLDDGRLVAVKAAEEALLEVRAGNPARLVRLAWQLGGSHVPAEVGPDVLYVPESAAELVRGSGCSASPVTRAFKPEKEAHDHSTCGHDHSHDHAHHHHDHGQAHDAALDSHGHRHDAHGHAHHGHHEPHDHDHAGHDHHDH
ncbi:MULTISPECIES: urease accessory protein UreE [Methylobacterium]|uniref:Urease accessory protein UreE n=1 Tax=Methylobacterium thuringiense TaxID=1003091 RepID=A0ABQ4TKH3_9HYPH|nr:MULTISPECIES: urease accessory protein UreE [Methylobacterium]TXN19379.1 urease accessory protein UreE [Methylobacterium sp. WL9]GJE54200.1 Urease accessory protein UreE [Methylobacterium thuringiense]